MAESIHEQIVVALRSSLAAITSDGGTTYWYTPAAVVRTLWFAPDEAVLKPGLGGPIYAIRPGEETHEEGTTGSSKGFMDLFVLVATPYTDSDTPHNPATVMRWTVVNRMVRDVLRKMLVDVQLVSAGGAVENVFANPVTVDRDRFVEGWAIAEIHFTIVYAYRNSTP